MIAAARKNFKVLLLFPLKTWQGYGRPSSSSNSKKVQLSTEVRHPDFLGRYYSHLYFRESRFFELTIVFQLTGINGLIFYNGGKEPGTFISALVQDGALQFCLVCTGEDVCREAYELKTGQWYILRVSVKKNEGIIRLNDGDAMQIMCVEGDYLPKSSLYVGGAGHKDWKIISEMTKKDAFLYGMIDVLTVNGLVVTYKMATLVDSDRNINSLGYSFADHVAEASEDTKALATLRCAVPDKVKRDHLAKIVWFEDMKQLEPGLGTEIVDVDGDDQSISTLTLHSNHKQGTYACILSSDGKLTNLHVFVLVRYSTPVVESTEARVGWIGFIILLLAVPLFICPAIAYYCTKDHPLWQKLGNFSPKRFYFKTMGQGYVAPDADKDQKEPLLQTDTHAAETDGTDTGDAESSGPETDQAETSGAATDGDEALPLTQAEACDPSDMEKKAAEAVDDEPADGCEGSPEAQHTGNFVKWSTEEPVKILYEREDTPSIPQVFAKQKEVDPSTEKSCVLEDPCTEGSVLEDPCPGKWYVLEPEKVVLAKECVSEGTTMEESCFSIAEHGLMLERESISKRQGSLQRDTRSPTSERESPIKQQGSLQRDTSSSTSEIERLSRTKKQDSLQRGTCSSTTEKESVTKRQRHLQREIQSPTPEREICTLRPGSLQRDIWSQTPQRETFTKRQGSLQRDIWSQTPQRETFTKRQRSLRGDICSPKPEKEIYTQRQVCLQRGIDTGTPEMDSFTNRQGDICTSTPERESSTKRLTFLKRGKDSPTPRGELFTKRQECLQRNLDTFTLERESISKRQRSLQRDICSPMPERELYTQRQGSMQRDIDTSTPQRKFYEKRRDICSPVHERESFTKWQGSLRRDIHSSTPEKEIHKQRQGSLRRDICSPIPKRESFTNRQGSLQSDCSMKEEMGATYKSISELQYRLQSCKLNQQSTLKNGEKNFAQKMQIYMPPKRQYPYPDTDTEDDYTPPNFPNPFFTSIPSYNPYPIGQPVSSCPPCPPFTGPPQTPCPPFAGPQQTPCPSFAGPQQISCPPFAGPQQTPCPRFAGPQQTPCPPFADPQQTPCPHFADPQQIPCPPFTGPQQTSFPRYMCQPQYSYCFAPDQQQTSCPPLTCMQNNQYPPRHCQLQNPCPDRIVPVDLLRNPYCLSGLFNFNKKTSGCSVKTNLNMNNLATDKETLDAHIEHCSTEETSSSNAEENERYARGTSIHQDLDTIPVHNSDK